LEYQARMIALSLGIPSFAAVDHWVNYNQRFIRGGVEILPDEIWISDDYAFHEARKCFPRIPIRQFSNYYLEKQVSAIKQLDQKLNKANSNNILYILEPIREKWISYDKPPPEIQALDYFLSRLDSLCLDSNVRIRLRPHPSETNEKYNNWIELNKNKYDISLDSDQPLCNAISWADLVVGCESFALVIALSAGKKTISTLPPWGHVCRLPHKNLIHLSNL
jgi:hypothetical protein